MVFAEDEDYQRYLSDLRDLKDAFGIKVYAFCLMTNHVHLFLAPGDSLSGLAQLMKTLAARGRRYRNRLAGPFRNVVESRYKSSVVQSDAYLLACVPVHRTPTLFGRGWWTMWRPIPVKLWAAGGLVEGAKLVGYMDPCFIELGQTAEEISADT